MAKISIVQGATSQSVNLWIQNSASTVGAGLTGLAYNTASLIAYYAFTGANGGSNVIALATLASATAAWATGGFIEIDSTHMPGLYRFDVPNALLVASKGQSVTIMLSGAANMAPLVLEIELTGWNNQDAVHGGMSAFPNVASGSNGAIPTTGTGANQIAVSSGAVTVGGYATNEDPATLVLGATATSWNTAGTIGAKINAGGAYTDPWLTALPGPYTAGEAGYIVGTYLNTTVSSRSTYAGGAVASVTGNVGGNVVGSVGSVVGAVGSVTAAVTVGGYSSGQDPATLVWSAALESGVTTLQGLQYIAASEAGTLSGAAGTTIIINAIGNASTPRITATVDANGNRIAVVLS